MVALLRSRTNPFNLLDSLGPMKSAAASLALWPIVILDEGQFQSMCRRLRKGTVRIDWITTDARVTPKWITRKVANSSVEYDWENAHFNPADNPGIQELLDLMQPGDELWWFSTSKESWSRLCGRAGYVVLRDGQQVAHLVLIMN